MKKLILICTLLCWSLLTFGQESKKVDLIVADSTWGQEIIQIPFWFAPEIEYEGVEDIRFANGWEKTDHIGFWTLVFAWDINLNSRPSTDFYKDNLQLYLDGLMKVVNEDTTITIPATEVLIDIGPKSTFSGSIKTYDAFTTKTMITLYVRIETYYCELTKRYVPLIKMSPKDFDHKAWKMLEQVTLNNSFCDP